MVATSGSGWKLSPCLVAMVQEADRIAPERSRIADGSIGDQSHQARTSDHNPSDGWVCAVDLTHDPRGGFDAHARARMAVARRDQRIKYVISNYEVARSYDKPGIPAWTWAPYTGSNKHVMHAHFSVHNTATARNDTASWWPHSQQGDDDMTPEQARQLADLHAQLPALRGAVDAHFRDTIARLNALEAADKTFDAMLRNSLASLIRAEVVAAIKAHDEG